MSRDISIAAATAADIDRLLPLVEQYWRFEAIEGFDAQRLAGLLRRVMSDASLGNVWLAEVDGNAAGYLLAVYVFSLEHQGLTAEIDEFFVGPSYRSLGIGTRLLAAAEATFLVRGCTNVALQIGRDNEEARAFYRRHGYGDRAGFDIVDKDLA
ncbi:MAG TPA: GNAT family N-acetyltransferase [Steroidobacteraceae bacterium]|jgi:GNAT superfamily N-acetyltransferase|nr:GNAT family N-acetyltransferase [Steroidobacteraceae bacterium]